MVPHAVIPALRRPRQKDEEFKVGYMVNEFQANLEYIVSLKMNIRGRKEGKGEDGEGGKEDLKGG